MAERAVRQVTTERAAARQRKGKRKVAERPEKEGVATAVAGHEGVLASVSAMATAVVPVSQHGMKTVG